MTQEEAIEEAMLMYAPDVTGRDTEAMLMYGPKKLPRARGLSQKACSSR